MGDFFMGLLIYLLASAATMSVVSVFGISMNIFQAISIWIMISFLAHIVKNY